MSNAKKLIESVVSGVSADQAIDRSYIKEDSDHIDFKNASGGIYASVYGPSNEFQFEVYSSSKRKTFKLSKELDDEFDFKAMQAIEEEIRKELAKAVAKFDADLAAIAKRF